MNKNPIMQAVALVNSRQKHPVLAMVRKSPEQAALVSKLTTQPLRETTYDEKGNITVPVPNTYEFKSISRGIAQDIADAETVLTMHPDMELSRQILVSSIISPKDMVSTELIFTAPDGVLPNRVAADILTLLRTHFDKDYKIKPKLSKILSDALFHKGSHILAVIPENSADELINRGTAVTMESLKEFVGQDGRMKNLGILGRGQDAANLAVEENAKKPGLGLEGLQEYSFQTSYSSSVRVNYHSKDVLDKAKKEKRLPSDRETTLTDELPYLMVTDNPDVLKLPSLTERLRQERLASAFQIKGGAGRLSMESLVQRYKTQGRAAEDKTHGESISPKRVRRLGDRELMSLTHKRSAAGYNHVVMMRTQEQLSRRTVGNPLVQELPSESVIPVHVPGQPDKHVGYFVLLDAGGNPLTMAASQDPYKDIAGGMGNTSSMPSQLITRVQYYSDGFDCSKREHLDYSARVFGDLIEQDLMARLRNGVYTNGVALARNEEVYRLMLARTLQRQQTQLLFLPVEFVTYFAFKYSGDGVGRSLLTDMKVLNSLRSTIMFSNLMASVRNATGQTNVNLKLDENDPNPQKSIERAMHEILAMRQSGGMPVGVLNPSDLTTFLATAGFNFTFEGHPGMPDMKVDVTQSNSNYTTMDPQVEENLRKKAIMGFGLNPESVDTSFNGEFATSVVQNNVMLSRRVLQTQELFCPMLTDHLAKYAFASENVMEGIRDILGKEWNELSLPEHVEQDFKDAGITDTKAAGIEYLMTEFLRGFEVSLPRPDNTNMKNQMEAFQLFLELLEPLLNAWIDAQFITAQTNGDVGNTAEMMKATARAFFIRKWQTDNGVMPELAMLTSSSEDDEKLPMVDFGRDSADHAEAIGRSFASFFKKTQTARTDGDAVMKATGVSADGGGYEASAGMSGGGMGMDTGSGGDLGLGGDFDDPLSAGGDSATETTETTEESTTTMNQAPEDGSDQPATGGEQPFNF